MNDRDRNALRTSDDAGDLVHGDNGYSADVETLRQHVPLKRIVTGGKPDNCDLPGHNGPVENSMAPRATAARDEAPATTEQEDLRIRNTVLKQLMKAGLSGTEWALGIEARSRALLAEGPTADDLYRAAIDRLTRWPSGSRT